MLLEMYMEIIQNQQKIRPATNFNLNYIDQYLDNICGLLSQLNFLSKEALWDMYSEFDTKKRLDNIMQQAQNYITFALQVTDIGQLAQDNIKQKKINEFFGEVYNIVKSAVEGQKGKKSFISKLKKQLEGKTMPDHIREIFKTQTQRLLALDEASQET